ncbi:hypothetical protein AB1Y20_000891 [Prymnesium parvum]|uniref:Uncharacterized protein n=1 Tax=Prymnesium parvum TaxID=97485 RepID=A0AB34K690_PRYPA|mmetsp:Transcript_34781/g.86515  ORF Transcript_34781/g.86515 Transcript_34781/m.86515 type:complete len:143 (+) Transcript_34781:29-457(+)|eukprot:CAMPEP_0182835084 /NCGR_PEP_ID=MMETSP0006_2-20121128/21299_1 /TAXON_ID=97485 /ORGANISM="Prymnesium parvum, Strain Texoma1" /LENGTH=142 /DNA_ID=CAMNT_0024963453 /DNA_START=145 /DNA_END=573 /DNA_ORIENTATION=-
MSTLFGPNYGAAQAHIQELMSEREDFLEVNKAQASRISALESELSAITEQLEVSTLIAESRSRQIEDLETANRRKDELLLKLRTTLRLLWGVNQQAESVAREQHRLFRETNELVETMESQVNDLFGTKRASCEVSAPASGSN